MSCLHNDMIMEGLADEFYDDVPAALSWMRKNGASLFVDQKIDDDNALCEMFVNMGMEALAGKEQI